MRQSIFKHALLLLLVLFSLASCKKDPIEEPIPSHPPQQEFPNPLPAYARVSQLQWDINDYETFSYNNQGQVANVHSQWQYVEGDPTKIRAIDYGLTYDAAFKPVRIDQTGGYYTVYSYQGNNVEKTQDFYGSGALFMETSYHYANERLAYELKHVKNLPGEPDDMYKYNFSYDGKGNMNKVEKLQRDSSGQYIWMETVEYSNFDGKINPTSWMLRFPYLPQMRFQFHNPRKEVRKQPNVPDEITVHAYTYNEAGLPILRRTTKPDGFVVEMEYKY